MEEQKEKNEGQVEEKKLSAHEMQELKRKQREEEEQKIVGEKRRKKLFKRVLVYGIIILIVGGLGFWFYKAFQGTSAYTKGQVHWHVLLDIEICGEKRDLPRVPPGLSHLGSALLHTHDDNTIHVEGTVRKEEDVKLGKFFDAINAEFDKDKIMDKKNGDLCDGKAGSVKMFVNDAENNEFRDYIIKDTFDAKKQVIKIVFD